MKWSDEMKGIKKVVPWLLVALWMMVIFYFSHQPATQSSHLSSGITQMLMDILKKVMPNVAFDVEGFHYLVRKNAHFFVYLVLGLLVVNGLRSSGIKGYKKIGISIAICVLYAISDEVHQLFVPGRAGQIKDVLIDSSGAIVGILIGGLTSLR